MWCRAGPCFTSVFECCRVPGTVMIPQDFDELHPCNLTLQRQKADGIALETTSEYYRALKGTQRTAARAHNFFRAGPGASVSRLTGGFEP